VLNLKSLGHLAEHLQTTTQHLQMVAEAADQYCSELLLLDPLKAKKPRRVIMVRGDLRKLQQRLLTRVLLRRLKPSPYSHGSIRGTQHKNQRGGALKVDFRLHG
jgi:hypothetical protein